MRGMWLEVPERWTGDNRRGKIRREVEMPVRAGGSETTERRPKTNGQWTRQLGGAREWEWRRLGSSE